MNAAERRAYKEDLFKQQTTQQIGPNAAQANWCSGYYLTNVQYQGVVYNWRVRASEGMGPIQLQIVVSQGVSATFSANVGVSAEVVSAGVGYSFATSYAVSSMGTWNVPSGVYGRLEAYPLYYKHTWNVWNDGCGGPTDTYAGSGRSYRPNGSIYFRKVYL